MHGGSASGSISTLSMEEHMVLSSEGSSCPDESELELGLGLRVGSKSQRDSRVSSARAQSVSPRSSSSCSSSASLSRANASAGTKRTADSVAAGNASGQVVGWPPIRTYRMNSMVNQAKLLATEQLNQKSGSKNGLIGKGNNHTGHVKVKAPQFVKVNMDGIPIGRKVDLTAQGCYEALAETLEEMFLQPPTSTPTAVAARTRSSTQEFKKLTETHASKLLDGSFGFVLTYEDKEGDWMLVGDVPWRMFLSSVKRLRIMKTSEATGISSRETNHLQRSDPV